MHHLAAVEVVYQDRSTNPDHLRRGARSNRGRQLDIEFAVGNQDRVKPVGTRLAVVRAAEDLVGDRLGISERDLAAVEFESTRANYRSDAL